MAAGTAAGLVVTGVSMQSLRPTGSDRVAVLALLGVAAVLLAFLAGPLAAILVQALQDAQGRFIGLANFGGYLRSPALLQSLWNSLWVSALVTAITIPAAFAFAYALTRSCMPLKPLLRGITLIPLLAPSLLFAIALNLDRIADAQERAHPVQVKK